MSTYNLEVTVNGLTKTGKRRKKTAYYNLPQCYETSAFLSECIHASIRHGRGCLRQEFIDDPYAYVNACFLSFYTVIKKPEHINYGISFGDNDRLTIDDYDSGKQETIYHAE